MTRGKNQGEREREGAEDHAQCLTPVDGEARREGWVGRAPDEGTALKKPSARRGLRHQERPRGLARGTEKLELAPSPHSVIAPELPRKSSSLAQMLPRIPTVPLPEAVSTTLLSKIKFFLDRRCTSHLHGCLPHTGFSNISVH